MELEAAVYGRASYLDRNGSLVVSCGCWAPGLSEEEMQRPFAVIVSYFREVVLARFWYLFAASVGLCNEVT